MKMEFNFNYKGKNFDIEVKECRGVFSKFRGLMFRKNSKPLLFIFKKPKKRTIHSLFCKPFIAIWFNNDKIIDVRKINSWRFLIKPKEKFNKLLEIPSGNGNFKYFIDDWKALNT